MFVGFDLPISFDSLSIDDIIELGDAYIDRTVTDNEIRAALSFIDADLQARE